MSPTPPATPGSSRRRTWTCAAVAPIAPPLSSLGEARRSREGEDETHVPGLAWTPEPECDGFLTNEEDTHKQNRTNYVRSELVGDKGGRGPPAQNHKALSFTHIL